MFLNESLQLLCLHHGPEIATSMFCQGCTKMLHCHEVSWYCTFFLMVQPSMASSSCKPSLRLGNGFGNWVQTWRILVALWVRESLLYPNNQLANKYYSLLRSTDHLNKSKQRLYVTALFSWFDAPKSLLRRWYLYPWSIIRWHVFKLRIVAKRLEMVIHGS